MKCSLIFTFIALLLLTGCEATKSNNYGSSSNNSTSSQTTQTMSTLQTEAPASGDTIAIMTTSKGVIKIKLFPKLVPETAKNFTELSKKGFYDGLIFHRVISDFMIQGGDPLGTGFGGESYKGPGTKIKDEFSKELTHIPGALSMANAGPNTGSSQFFIVQSKNGTHYLNGKHAIFGQVYEGMDVVDAIANVPADANDMPNTPVKIKTVVIEEVK